MIYKWANIFRLHSTRYKRPKENIRVLNEFFMFSQTRAAFRYTVDPLLEQNPRYRWKIYRGSFSQFVSTSHDSLRRTSLRRKMKFSIDAPTSISRHDTRLFHKYFRTKSSIRVSREQQIVFSKLRVSFREGNHCRDTFVRFRERSRNTRVINVQSIINRRRNIPSNLLFSFFNYLYKRDLMAVFVKRYSSPLERRWLKYTHSKRVDVLKLRRISTFFRITLPV